MKQIVIVVDNRPGLVADVSALLGDKNVNIDSIEADTLGKMGVIRIIVQDYDLALKILRDHGFNALTEEVFLIRIDDKPGALAQVAKKFKEGQIDITSLRLVERDGEYAIAAISCERAEEARELFKDILIQ
jgi:hypothetical protein